jgi:hypothetical protein
VNAAGTARGLPAALNLAFVHNALLHDEVNPLEHADIGERMTLRRDEQLIIA